jgi:hypothetical protein
MDHQYRNDMENGSENQENDPNSPNASSSANPANYTPLNMTLLSETELEKQWKSTVCANVCLPIPPGIVDIEDDHEGGNYRKDYASAPVLPKMFQFGAIVNNPKNDKIILEVPDDSTLRSIYGHPSNCSGCVTGSGVHKCGRRALAASRRHWESDNTTSSDGQFVPNASSSKTTSTHSSVAAATTIATTNLLC